MTTEASILFMKLSEPLSNHVIFNHTKLQLRGTSFSFIIVLLGDEVDTPGAPVKKSLTKLHEILIIYFYKDLIIIITITTIILSATVIAIISVCRCRCRCHSVQLTVKHSYT